MNNKSFLSFNDHQFFKKFNDSNTDLIRNNKKNVNIYVREIQHYIKPIQTPDKKDLLFIRYLKSDNIVNIKTVSSVELTKFDF